MFVLHRRHFGLQLVHPHQTPRRFCLKLCCHCCLLFVLLLCSSLWASLILQTGSRCTSFWTGANIGCGNNLSPRTRPDVRSPGEWVTFTRKLLDFPLTTSFSPSSLASRGEFLAGFLKDAANIILNTEPAREVEEPRSAAGSSSSSSSSSTSSSSSSDGEPAPSGTQPRPRVLPQLGGAPSGHHERVGDFLRAEHHGQ